MPSRTLALIPLLFLAPAAHTAAPAPPSAESPGTEAGAQWQPVAGSGVHRFTTAIVHSSEPTETGLIQHSTETVELSGDLVGRVLYHPRSVFDFAAGTLVNTGNQVFSGTILGSAPVLLHDTAFRFDIDLATGATVGEVHLVDTLAGPIARCHLHVVGTGLTAEGDATFDYTGECLVGTEPAAEAPPPPYGAWIEDSAYPGFRFQVRITPRGNPSLPGAHETACQPETLCVSGAVPGRSEALVRLLGPRPNGYLWPTIVRFTPSEIEVWIEQQATGDLRYYRLAPVIADHDPLTGTQDRQGFLP